MRFALARKMARPLARAVAVGSLVHPLATWLARFDWRADLIAHFQEPALAVSLLAAASMARIRRPIAVGLGLLALGQVWSLARYEWPNPVPPDPRTSATLRVLMANVLVDNVEYDGLIRLIQTERPDVFGVIELSHGWAAGLGPIRSEYPYRFEFPNDDSGTGIALYFRRPPISVESVPFLAPGGMPALHAIVDFDGIHRHLWLVHLVSPFERPDELPLGREFVALAERARRHGGSTLVLGDFNSTDGSPHFARFLEASGLRDSRFGFGRQRSWPSWSPYRIAIDHAFLSPDLAVKARRLGPRIGSDHFPLILDIAPAARPATKGSAQATQSSTDSGESSANLARSASRRNSTSFAISGGSSRSPSAGSAAISSVVLEAQADPNASIKTPRTVSETAISR